MSLPRKTAKTEKPLKDLPWFNEAGEEVDSPESMDLVDIDIDDIDRAVSDPLDGKDDFPVLASDKTVADLARNLPKEMTFYKQGGKKIGGRNSPGIHGGLYHYEYITEEDEKTPKKVTVLFKQDTKFTSAAKKILKKDPKAEIPLDMMHIHNEKNIAEVVFSDVMNYLIGDSVASCFYATVEGAPRQDETGESVYVGSVFYPTRNNKKIHYKDFYKQVYELAGIPVPESRPLAIGTGGDLRVGLKSFVKEYGPNEKERLRLLFLLNQALESTSSEEKLKLLNEIKAADPVIEDKEADSAISATKSRFGLHEYAEKLINETASQDEIREINKKFKIDYDALYDLIGKDKLFDDVRAKANAEVLQKQYVIAEIKRLGTSSRFKIRSDRRKLIKLIFRYGFLKDKENQVRGESKSRFEDFEKVTIASLLVGDFDVHSGNYGVVTDADGKQRLVKIDHGAAGNNIELYDGKIHMHSHSHHMKFHFTNKFLRKRFTGGPTNHFREFPRTLKISLPFANEIDSQVDKMDKDEFHKCIDASLDRTAKFYGARPILDFTRRLGVSAEEAVEKYRVDLKRIEKEKKELDETSEAYRDLVSQEQWIQPKIVEASKHFLKKFMEQRKQALKVLSLEIRLSLCIKRKPDTLLPDFYIADQKAFRKLVLNNPLYFTQGKFHFRGGDQSLHILSGLRWHIYDSKLTDLVNREVKALDFSKDLDDLEVDDENDDKHDDKRRRDSESSVESEYEKSEESEKSEKSDKEDSNESDVEEEEEKRPKKIHSSLHTKILFFDHEARTSVPNGKIASFADQSIVMPIRTSFQQDIAQQINGEPAAKLEANSEPTDQINANQFRLNTTMINHQKVQWAEHYEAGTKKLVSEIVKADFMKSLGHREPYKVDGKAYHFPRPEIIELALRHFNSFIAARTNKTAPIVLSKVNSPEYVEAMLLVCAARNVQSLPKRTQIILINRTGHDVENPNKETILAFLDYFNNNAMLKTQLTKLAERTTTVSSSASLPQSHHH